MGTTSFCSRRSRRVPKCSLDRAETDGTFRGKDETLTTIFNPDYQGRYD